MADGSRVFTLQLGERERAGMDGGMAGGGYVGRLPVGMQGLALVVAGALVRARRMLDGRLEPRLRGVPRWWLVACAVAGTWGVSRGWRMLRALARAVEDHGVGGALVQVLVWVANSAPGVKQLVRAEKAKVIAKIAAKAEAQGGGEGEEGARQRGDDKGPAVGLGSVKLTALPREGMERGALREKLEELARVDDACSMTGRLSGAVYMEQDHGKFLTECFGMFAYANPLHGDVFKSVVRMESEVVAMAASILGAPPGSKVKVVGNVTSGGTESILMACKAARDFAKETRGVTEPEIVFAVSAHAAFDKAASYFGLRVRRMPVDADLCVDLSAVRRAVNRNTVLLVGSAPGFPHGVLDPIEGLAEIARKHRIPLHVDACLGGFCLPFVRRLAAGRGLPRFDFSVDGVTSMSADMHKYGLAHKGVSVVLYSDRALRRCQFSCTTEWTGGLYISPTIAGSRPGGLSACAWASMVSLGEAGFLRITDKLMETTRAFISAIERTDGVRVLGKPCMTVVALASADGLRPNDIYAINDVLLSRGWHLNALQRPPAVHIAVTLQHAGMADAFGADLAHAVDEVRRNPKGRKDSMAPVYGMAGSVPDRGAIGDILKAYMDVATL